MLTSLSSDIPRFSVVCIGRNVSYCVEELLCSLNNQSNASNFEFVFVDDCSTDGTCKLVSDYCSSKFNHSISYKIVQNPTNLGINGARNAGVRNSSGTYVLLCDSDDILSHNWADTMVTAMEAGHDFVCGTNVEFGIGGKSAQPRQLINKRTQTGGAPICAGNNIGFTRKLFDTVDGFPPEFPVVLYGKRPTADDHTFCWYVWLRGFMLHRCQTAIIHYRQPHSLSAAAKQQFGYGMGGLILEMLFSSNQSQFRWLIVDCAYLVMGVITSPWILLKHGKFDFVGRMARRFGRVVLLTLGQRNPEFHTVLNHHKKIMESMIREHAKG